MIIDCYKISDLMSKKHPQKKETLILTFSEPFFSIVAVFVLKMALVFFAQAKKSALPLSFVGPPITNHIAARRE